MYFSSSTLQRLLTDCVVGLQTERLCVQSPSVWTVNRAERRPLLPPAPLSRAMGHGKQRTVAQITWIWSVCWTSNSQDTQDVDSGQEMNIYLVKLYWHWMSWHGYSCWHEGMVSNRKRESERERERPRARPRERERERVIEKYIKSVSWFSDSGHTDTGPTHNTQRHTTDQQTNNTESNDNRPTKHRETITDQQHKETWRQPTTNRHTTDQQHTET